MNRPKTDIPKGRTKYFFNIYSKSKKRVKVQTGSSDKDIAERMVDDYMRIIGLELDDPISLAVNEKVYKAYFGQSKSRIPVKSKLLDPIFSEKERIIIDEKLKGHPDILIKLSRLVVEADERIKTINAQTENLQGYDELKKSIIAKQVEASKNCPSFTDCIDEFELTYRENVSYSQYTAVLSMSRRLAEVYPDVNPAEITRHQIRDFIMGLASESTHPEYRKKKVRSMLSPFFTWVSDRYDFQSPIVGMVLMKKKITEKRKITWHDLPVIEEILSGLDSYWRAVVATMAYAGIGLKELSGIRLQDFTSAKRIVDAEEGPKEIEAYFLKIEWHDQRGLKTKNRSDSVPVDAKFLLPHLLQYLKDGHSGEKYLFPKPKSMRKTNSPEMWTSDKLSEKLVGRKYPKDKETGEQKINPGILPKGFLARDLRHTFGSLLIRNGYSIDEAAALSRNERDVFVEHYGHLVAKDLTVSLSGESKKIKYLQEKPVIKKG